VSLIVMHPVRLARRAPMLELLSSETRPRGRAR
jgi:hypothetical protein